MHERDEILVMLLAAGFFGTSFWPVACGWVDLETVAGWVELCSNFGTVLLVGGVFGSMAAIGFMLGCLLRWCLCESWSRSALELGIRLRSLVRRLWVAAYWTGFHAARILGRTRAARVGPCLRPPLAKRGVR